jgi:cell division topological specificity factor
MSLLNFLFNPKQPKTASVAKERLQLIIAHEGSKKAPDFLPKLKEELLAVVAKYMHVSEDSFKLDLQRRDNTDILEINLIIEDKKD